MADFEGEEAIWFEGVVGLGNEAAVDFEAGFAGEERGGGFVVADLGVEGGAVGLGDVGRVADDWRRRSRLRGRVRIEGRIGET